MAIENEYDVTIANGNRLYKNENYLEAIEVYKQVAALRPSFAEMMNTNIALAMGKLRNVQPGVEHNAKEIRPQDNDTMAERLSRPLNPVPSKDLPESTVIFKLLSSLTASDITISHLISALHCAAASPFQRDILWYIATLSNCLRLNVNLVNFQATDHICLQTMITMASDRKEWLLNRARLRQWILANKINDPRAWDLVDNPPDEFSDNYQQLPEFRPVSTRRYQWDNILINNRYLSQDYSITFGTIFLNEKKFIGLNLLQHYELCDSWVLVEGACKGYPTRKVTSNGLSLDNSSAFIRLFPDPLFKIKFIQHGWTSCSGEDAKSELRNRYLENCTTDYLLVVDADEFYLTKDFMAAMNKIHTGGHHALTLPQIHFWKNSKQFITGEYYDVSHIRLHRNTPGMRYIKNHNFPEIFDKYTHEISHQKVARVIKEVANGGYTYDTPACFHMGFAKDYDDMKDKSDYYINRGEAVTRKVTTESRAAWFTENIPEKCILRPWEGEIPAALSLLEDSI